MPLVRIDLRKGKPAAYKKAIGEAIYRAMRETFEVPDEDRFMVVTEHDDDGFFYSKTYLNIERTGDLTLIQLTVTNSRNVDQKKALCSRKASHYPAHDVSPVMTVITCLIWVTFNRVAKEADGPMADTNFDVLIIGSGPGGYVTAIRAAQLGFKTAIVEREYLGGICLNWGCIPTKALLRSAEIFHYFQHAKDYGLSADKVGYDPKAVVERSRKVAQRLSTGVGFLMKKNKVQVIWGEALIDAPGKVTVKAGRSEAPKGALGPGAYQAKHIIIATGARPRVLPGIEPDQKLIWTYFEAMVPDRVPKSLLVIGSGAIGIEFASFFRTLGSDVTVVEVLPQILPVEDAEIAALARKQFEKQGMKIFTGAKVTKLEKKANAVAATYEDAKGNKQTAEFERVISAVGVVGNIEDLGLEKLGVKTERGTIV